MQCLGWRTVHGLSDVHTIAFVLNVVETSTRPARFALVVSDHASNRVLRRAFRLAGGRWGGRYDVIVSIGRDGSISDFYRAVLGLADPDYVLVLDPNLDGHAWDSMLRELDIQPFEVIRFRERAEYLEYEHLFVESPSPIDPEDPDQAVLDLDRPGLEWQEAAECGLPWAQTVRERKGRREEVATPVRHGGQALTARVGAWRWLVFGPSDSADLALRYWSLRALGARPVWLAEDDLDEPSPPDRVLRAYLMAPHRSASELADVADRWSAGYLRFRPAPTDPRRVLRRRETYFASHLASVAEHEGVLRFSLPSPPFIGQPFERHLYGTAEHRIVSPDPGDPDGYVLARDEASRVLVSRLDADNPWRITRWGIAEIREIQRPALVALPAVRYQDALAAPLSEGGFKVEASDKGRYQQRSLTLARGLRFLAWVLRQRESARLLDLFDEYHGTGSQPPDYRRAVRYDELEQALYSALRENRSRLRAPLRAQAQRWLREWADQMLERGLLVGGYVLACDECARRTFYKAEQVGQSFECQRCTHENLVSATARRCFQLNEAFHQLRHNHGDVVTLLLAELRQEAKLSLLYQPEVVLRGSNSLGEVDSIALVDGNLILAEAKSANELTASEVRWYRYVAGRTRTRRLLFATTSRQRPLCARLACDTCRERGGAHHRDYAWSDGGRTLVEETRQRLADKDVSVETLCYERLVAGHSDAQLELRTFAESRRATSET
jgi:hypothetical protein